jgi:hypothetical protein
VGAAHIALLDSGDIQNLQIRVTDYAPRATKKVPYINRELQWSIGEKRTYGVYKDGQKIGTETAEVGDIEVVDGEEVYHFTARSEIKGVAGTQTTVAEQLLNPQALPRKIVLSYKDAAKDEATTYEFNEDTVLIRPGKPGSEIYDKDKGREYPFAKGTYFTDPRLLSQWALMVGQVPLTEGSEKEFPIHAFLPERKTSREMELDVGELETVHMAPTLALPDEEKGDQDKPETPISPEDGSQPATPAPEPSASPSPAPSASPTPEASEDGGGAEPEEGGSESSPAEEPEQAQPQIDGAASPSPSQTENGVTETRSTKERLDALTAPDPNAIRATHIQTDTGMEFWLNERGQVVKIEIPDQGLELILEKVESTIE